MFNFKQLNQAANPLIIAHRGASKVEHENTLVAFTTAIEMGADAIEFDVRRTADGVLIVHHNLLAPRSRRRVNNLTYDQLLKEYKTKKIHIPTLQETLDLCSGKIALDIELKEPGYEEEVVALVEDSYDLKHVAFTSFVDNTVARLKEVNSEVIAGLLIGLRIPARFISRTRRLRSLERIQRSGADFAAPNWKLVQRGFVRRMQAANIPIVVWTVDRISTARKLSDLGIAGIITNRPDRTREAIHGT